MSKEKLDPLALPVLTVKPERPARTAAKGLRALMVQMALQALLENKARKEK